jgi:hypothetical protein
MEMEKVERPQKQQAFEWFRGAASPLSPASSTVAKAWEHAWRPLEAGADLGAWKTWVTQTVSRASSRSAHSPEGLWLHLLRDGPGGDLTKAQRPSAQQRWAEIDKRSEAYVRMIREARETGGHPPLEYAMRALQQGRTPADVYEAWEAAGRPEDFPYPW